MGGLSVVVPVRVAGVDAFAKRDRVEVPVDAAASEKLPPVRLEKGAIEVGRESLAGDPLDPGAAHGVARQQARAGVLNARLDAAGLRDHCHLPADAQALLEMAANRFALSARALDSARRVARTLADLSAEESISRAHLAEALSLRADRGKADGLIAG